MRRDKHRPVTTNPATIPETSQKISPSENLTAQLKGWLHMFRNLTSTKCCWSRASRPTFQHSRHVDIAEHASCVWAAKRDHRRRFTCVKMIDTHKCGVSRDLKLKISGHRPHTGHPLSLRTHTARKLHGREPIWNTTSPPYPRTPLQSCPHMIPSPHHNTRSQRSPKSRCHASLSRKRATISATEKFACMSDQGRDGVKKPSGRNRA